MGSESQLAFLYVYIYIIMFSSHFTRARAQNGTSGSYMYMDAIFKLVVHERSGQVYHIILPRKAYNSVRINRICVTYL